MTTITIETAIADKPMWRALVGNKVSFGKTAGEALDHLTAQLNEEDSSAIVVRQMQPDRFFTAAQQQRMAELMTKWRAARDAGNSLLPAEQTELEALAEAELNGSAQRAEQLFHDLNN